MKPKIYLFYTITCFLLSLNFVTTRAQEGLLIGNIQFEDGEPAISAIVQIKELQKNTVTNVDGQFVFTALPFGNYTLDIGSMEAEKKQVLMAVNESNIKMNVVLERSVVRLSEVVIQAKSQKNQIETQGFAAYAVETKHTQLQSIPTHELLDRASGVRIKQGGGLGSKVEYNINGLSGNSVRVFIEGIPISNYGSSFSLSSIPTSMIERIEIYKGVVPTHLSDDILGGAINVVLKQNSKNSLSTSYSLGSFNTHQWSANGSFRNAKTGFTAKGSLFYNHSDNDYKVWGDKIYITDHRGKIEYIKAKRFHDQYKSAGGTFDVGFTDVIWADLFLLGAVVSGKEKEVQHGATMGTVYGNRVANQNTQMLKLNYQKKDLFVEGFSATLFTSYSHAERMIVDTVPYIYNWLGKRVDYSNDGVWEKWASGAEAGRPTLAKNPENRFTGRANFSYQFIIGHTLGVNYITSYFKREPNDPMKPVAERILQDSRKMDKSILGITLENKWLKDRLTTSFFAKAYYQNMGLKEPVSKSGVVSQLEFSKSTQDKGLGYALSYQMFSKLTLLSSAEKAVRLPEHTEIFGNDAQNIDSSYDLKPEKSENINMGFHLGRFIWGNHSLSNSTNLFYRHTKDMIRQAVASQHTETYAFENQESVLSTGFDTELIYSYKKSWNASFNLSSFNAIFNKERDEYGAKYLYYGDRLRNEPYFTMNGNIRYATINLLKIGGRTSFTYNWNYVHAFYRDWASLGGSNKVIIPTQSVHDLGVTHHFKREKLAISFDAKNIFNQQVFDNWALQKPGRSFFIKINYTIL